MWRCSSIFLLSFICAATIAEAGRSRPAKPVFDPVPKTAKQLQQRALQALADGDVEAMGRLTITPADAFEYCPANLKMRDIKQIQREYDRLRHQVKAATTRCASLFDWRRAKIVSIKGGVIGKPGSRCSGKITQMSDITVIYEVDGRRYRVKLDDPIRLGKKSFTFKLSDDPSCREVTP